MLSLQQISRSIRINPSVLRYISTTKIRQDDNNDKSLSDNQKQDIRQKLKSLKEKLFNKNDSGKEAEQTHTTFGKSEESASVAEDVKPKTVTKVEFHKKAPLVNTNVEKEEKQLKEKQKSSLKNILEHETEVVKESENEPGKLPEKKDVDFIEVFNRQKAAAQMKEEAKKQKRKLKTLLEEPADMIQESKEDKLKNLDEVKEHTIKDTDVEKPKSEDEKEEDSKAEILKGRMKLRELIEQSKKFSVPDKVKITHPERKIRPVEKAAKKAESNKHIKMLKSIKEVADELGGNVDKTETELMNAVFKSTASKESEEKRLEDPTKGKMSSVLDDLNVDLKKDAEDDSQIEIKRTLSMIRDLQRRGKDTQPDDYSDYRSRATYPVFDAKPLNIFDEEYLSNLKESIVLEVYDKVKEKELVKLVTHSPANIFEEMIKWTKEGKLWHFPIDNEWKWSWEENVDFTEHVLLEHHLESWCPTGGPIRHFMELVCVGLGKNPFITAEEKREHIFWYRDYFEEKRRLLEDVGAFRAENKRIEQGETVS